MKTKILLLMIVFISIIGTSTIYGQKRYSGGSHTSNHGGHYANGRGSSHRGGSYKNKSTKNHYGKHKH